MKYSYTIVRIVNAKTYLFDERYHLSLFIWIMKDRVTVVPGTLESRYRYPLVYLVYLLYPYKWLQRQIARLFAIDLDKIAVLDFLSNHIDEPYKQRMLKEL